MNKKLLPLAAAVMLAMGGCGGGGGGGSSSSSSSGSTNSDGEVLSSLVSGIEIPSEISAVPADTTGTTAKTSSKVNSFSSALRVLAATTTTGLSATSDYVKAKPSVYVEERSLEQFDVIETVFKALAQTHYADDVNVNAGPYKAMISWEEEQGGKDVKTLQTWTVESRMIVMDVPSDVTGNTTGDVNKLYAWIPEIDRETGQERLIKAEFLIYTAPTKASDDSLIDYGEWDMNVLMNGDATGVDTVTGTPDNFFAASARVGTDGSSILTVHENHTEMPDFGSGPVSLAGEMKGILYRNGSDGYGMVSYPDWETCWQFDFSSGTSPCASGTVPVNDAKYAYNVNYLGVQEINDGTAATAVYKDRNLDGAIHVVHRYGLFYADADATAGIAEGDSVEKHLSFGFPVSFTNTATGSSTTYNDFAYYGAWQGRHQLWGSGNYPTGATFSRQDVRPGDPVATYTLKEFNGTVTKRSLVSASLTDIQDIPVETWLNDHSDLFYQSAGASGAGWYQCDGDFNWGDSMCYTKGSDMTNPANQIPFTLFTDYASLSVSSTDRKQVNIGACMSTCVQYVYLASDPAITGFTFAGAGFYEANWGTSGRLEPNVPAAILTPTDGLNIWIDIGGSVYVAYTGEFAGPTTTTGWVQKQLASFDESTWTPTFTSGADTAFTPDRGMEYYMNAKGQNYVVTRTDADATAGFQTGDYSVKLELQTAANPVNTNSTTSASILPTGTSYLASPWDTTHSLKLTLVSDPANTNYLLLTVVSDASSTYTAGDLYTEGSWGLVAYNVSDQPLAADGTALTVDAYGWIDPSANGGKEPVQFNYEYAGTGNDWGKQQFLVYASNPPTGKSVGDYVILSDPITLNGVALYDNLGAATGESVSLQFDGWMHGLPDMYRELEKNGWSIDPTFGGKVRRLLAGQLVSDGTKNYFVKPMETSLFLGIVTAFPATPGQPDITQADGVDLTSVPNFTPHNMGGTPTTDSNGDPIEVKYSEGKAI